MCRQLNMEDSAQEIMLHLGMDSAQQISFSDFLRCRARVMQEAEQVNLVQNTEDTGIDSDTSGFLITKTTNMTSWPTMSSDSLGKRGFEFVIVVVVYYYCLLLLFTIIAIIIIIAICYYY